MIGKKAFVKGLRYAFLILLGVVMVFPLVLLFFSSFKTNNEIFGCTSILPETFITEGYIKGWQGMGTGGGVTFGHYILNTIKLVLPLSVFTVISSLVVAYGFARFEFPLKKFLFTLLMAFLLLPSSVLIIPRYLLFSKIGWVDTYLPFWVPACCATSSFFVYMFIQFFRGIPMEMDEAARLDGCGPWGIFLRILVPLCVPAIISAFLLQFIWGWNDFFQQNIYLCTTDSYTVSIALRMSMDATTGFDWHQIMAMTMVSIIAPTIIFLSMQKYFVEGIATSGLKG